MTASPVARIEQLDQIEKDVVGILQNAGQLLMELGKDRQSQKQCDQLCTAVRTTRRTLVSRTYITIGIVHSIGHARHQDGGH